MDRARLTTIKKLVENLTTSGEEQLNRELLRELKYLCQADGNETFYKQLGDLVFQQLQAKHAQIRYGALLLIDHLFHRPHQFRLYVCHHLPRLFDLTLENDQFLAFIARQRGIEFEPRPKLGRPPLQPKSWALKLKTKAVECFRVWHRKFGPGYVELDDGIDFLVEPKLCRPPKPVIQLEQTQKQEIARKYLDGTKRFESLRSEMERLIDQIDACIDILMPRFVVDDDEDEEEDFAYRPLPGLSINMILRSKVHITRTETNTDVIGNLQELCKELSGSPRARLKELEQHFKSLLPVVKVKSKIEEVLDKINELDVKTMTIVAKVNDFQITDAGSSDDDDFEEVPFKEEIFFQRLDEVMQAKEEEQASKLAKQAEELVNHEASSSSGESPACRHKLPSGRLCPRRDLIKCPFHGPRIARDNDGLPLDPEQRKQELEAEKKKQANQWKDPKYLQELSLKLGRDLVTKYRIKGKKRKYPGLIDLKKLKDTPRNRLMKKIKSKAVREKVEARANQDDEDRHRHYLDQWNYALSR